MISGFGFNDCPVGTTSIELSLGRSLDQNDNTLAKKVQNRHAHSQLLIALW
jgi:hypothetical protein